MRTPVVVVMVAAAAGLGGYFTSARLARRPEAVVAAFHKLYHARANQTYDDTYWMGTPTQQCPLDLWVFQEIIHQTKPDVLVEAGTYKGGSALYYAGLFDLLGHGRVVTIDIEAYPNRPVHPRISYVLGSSTDQKTVDTVKREIEPGSKVMVILDSDHHRDHVLRELRMYSPLVTQGMYLIVQDTHFNGHPVLPRYGPGPWEAVEDFLASGPPFRVDRGREKLLLSFNYGGYLQRTGAARD
jgi:cephalosporin hydroxylase